MRQLSISILNSNLIDIKKNLQEIEESGAEMVHFDVMDGNFVPNLTFGSKYIKDCRPNSKMIFDTHLMINNPEKYIDEYIDAGSDYLTFHYEACENSLDLLKYIKSKNVKAGISIKPNTKLSQIEELLPFCDLVLVMTVEPGFGGQSLIQDCVDKIEQLSKIENRNFKVFADGGINLETSKKVWDAGLEVAITGSAFFNAPNYKNFVESMKTNG